jgi:hypothetical protein
MSVVARLVDFDRNPWLARFRATGFSWWVVRPDDGSELNDGAHHLASAVADLVSGSPAGDVRVWVARVEGPPDAVRYASEVVLGGQNQDGSRHAKRWAVLPGLDEMRVLSLLDAADSVPISLVLLRVSKDDSELAESALGGEQPDGGLVAADLSVLKAAGASWAALGRPPSLPPPRARRVRALDVPEPAPIDIHFVRHRPEKAAPSQTLVALAVAVAVVLGGSGIAVWRLAHRGASPTPSAGFPSSGGAVSGTGSSTAVPLPVAALPSPRLEPSIAFDAAHDETVLFGGDNNADITWRWSGQHWSRNTPSVGPPGRIGAAMAYDPGMKRVLLFGGRSQAGAAFNDTWTWDGSTWRPVDVGGARPPGGESVSMSWDEVHGDMVLVDGAAAATWTLNGSTWTQWPTRSLVAPDQSHVMAFDPVTRTVLLLTVGGARDPYLPSSTWSWNGASWRQLPTAHSPPAGFASAMALDPVSGRLLVVAQSLEQGNPQMHTWSWDGRDWTQFPEATGPTDAPIGAVSDPAERVLEVFGWAAAGVPGPIHVWGWTGKAWTRLADGGDTAQFSPPSRQFAFTAYDERRRELVLYGGQSRGAGSTFALSDTWVYAHGRWGQAQTTSNPPTGGPMAFDPVTGTVLLVADANGPGFTNPDPVRPVTWSWDGVMWRALRPATELPAGSPPVAMITDPATGTVVAITICCVHSDGSLNPPRTLTTWVWDGSTWSNPHPRVELGGGLEVVLAYDSAARRVLAVGNDGATAPAATWAWDGRTWTQLHPTNDALFDPVTATMAGDPATGTVVLLERRFQANVTFNDAGGTQVWDGTTWTDHVNLVLSDANTAYGNAAFYVDADIGRLVIVSGGSQGFGEEWMWTGSLWLQLDQQAVG